MVDACEDGELVLAQFNRLIQELLRGYISRNCFRPWEVELLLDIESCHVKDSARRELLKRYQKAVERHMRNGAERPLKLSEYLEGLKVRREAVPPAASQETSSLA